MENYLDHNRRAYDATAEEFQRKIDSRHQNAIRFVKDFNAIAPNGQTVLELGPGSGYIAKLLSENGYDVTAIEFSEPMAKYAADTAPDAKIITGEFLGHDFKDSRFDNIIAMAFIHLFTHQDAVRALRKAFSLLKPKGLIFISTTQHEEASEGFAIKHNFSTSDTKRFRRRYTSEGLAELVTEAGFGVMQQKDIKDSDSGRVWIELICNKAT